MTTHDVETTIIGEHDSGYALTIRMPEALVTHYASARNIMLWNEPLDAAWGAQDYQQHRMKTRWFETYDSAVAAERYVLHVLLSNAGVATSSRDSSRVTKVTIPD